MAVSGDTGGTQACTLTTEHTLATITVAGTYQLVVDLDELQNDETLELRIYTKVRSASSSKLAFYAVYKHDQGGHATVYSPPIPAPFEFKATIEQNGGTGRSFIWSIYEY